MVNKMNNSLVSDVIRITGSKLANSSQNQLFGFRQELASRFGIDDISRFSKARFAGNQLGKAGLRAVGLDGLADKINIGDMFSSYRSELKQLRAERKQRKENEENGQGALEQALSKIEGIDPEKTNELLEKISVKFDDLQESIKPPEIPELKNTNKPFESIQLDIFNEIEEDLGKIEASITNASIKEDTNSDSIKLVEDKSLLEERKQTDILERILSQMSSRAPAEVAKPESQGIADSLFGGFGKRFGKFNKLNKFGKFARFLPGIGALAAGGVGLYNAYQGFSDEKAEKLFGKSNLLTKTGSAVSHGISSLSFGILSPEKVASTLKELTKPIVAIKKIGQGVHDKIKGVFTFIGDGFGGLFDWLAELPVIGKFFKGLGLAKTVGTNLLNNSLQNFNNFKNNAVAGMTNVFNGIGSSGGAGSYTAGQAIHTTTPAGKSVAKIINANDGKKGVTYQLEDGSIVKRTGDRNWRNNNPGNMEYNKYTASLGAIGSDGRFAIFPNMETGRKAKGDMLFNGARYKNLTLTAAIARYAPPHENNTAAYQKAVLSAVGVNKKMSDYTPAEREKILNAMQRVEGNLRSGKEQIIKPATKKVGNDQVNGKDAKSKVETPKLLDQKKKDIKQSPAIPPTIAKPVKESVPQISKPQPKVPLVYKDAANMSANAAPIAKPATQNQSVLPLNTDDKIDDLGLHMFVKGVLA